MLLVWQHVERGNDSGRFVVDLLDEYWNLGLRHPGG
jgi:hypothetical protein